MTMLAIKKANRGTVARLASRREPIATAAASAHLWKWMGYLETRNQITGTEFIHRGDESTLTAVPSGNHIRA
jgi:hypothetical protein